MDKAEAMDFTLSKTIGLRDFGARNQKVRFLGFPAKGVSRMSEQALPKFGRIAR